MDENQLPFHKARNKSRSEERAQPLFLVTYSFMMLALFWCAMKNSIRTTDTWLSVDCTIDAAATVKLHLQKSWLVSQANDLKLNPSSTIGSAMMPYLSPAANEEELQRQQNNSLLRCYPPLMSFHLDLLPEG